MDQLFTKSVLIYLKELYFYCSQFSSNLTYFPWYEFEEKSAPKQIFFIYFSVSSLKIWLDYYFRALCILLLHLLTADWCYWSKTVRILCILCEMWSLCPHSDTGGHDKDCLQAAAQPLTTRWQHKLSAFLLNTTCSVLINVSHISHIHCSCYWNHATGL